MASSSLEGLGLVRPGDNSSDVRRRHGYTCNGDFDSAAQPKRLEDSQFRTQKHGVFYSSAPTRINRLLRLLNVYIWIGILVCCVHLGEAMNNTTQDTNMTTVGLTTIITTTTTTELPEVTTDLATTEESGDDEGLPGWVFGVAAVGGVVFIVVIIIIIICIRRKCSSCAPPSPVNKNFTPSEDGIDRDSRYNEGYPDDNQGNVGIAMESLEDGIEETIYENTGIQPLDAQENPAFRYPQFVSHMDENFPNNPPPAPPTRTSNIDLDTRQPLGIPSPSRPTLPSPGPTPSSPIDDFPDLPPPPVPNQGTKDIKAELNHKFKNLPPPGKPNDKKKKKKKEKEDKPKTTQRFIDPNEQVRDGVQTSWSKTSPQSHPDTSIKFDFKTSPSQPEAGDDFGGNYEAMSPIDSSPVRGWSPRQPEDGDCGGLYEDVDGNSDGDYDDEYEVVDPNAPKQARKPPGMKNTFPAPFNLPGQRSQPDINQRPMVQPPATLGGDDYGGDYEEMCINESPKHRLPGQNIDHRPQAPIPIQGEEQDHGGFYEDMTSPPVSPKKKPPPAKPKTTKKPIKSPPAGDFGQEYGNTGVSATLPISTTQRLPPSLPSSSTLPQTHWALEDNAEGLLPPPPPPGLHQRLPPRIPSPDEADHGGFYDDVEIKPTIKQKPPVVSKPKVAKKPSNTISSSAILPPSPASDRTEPTEEDSVYMNLPGLKGNTSKHYHNLPAPERIEHISSSGYSSFTERPK